MADPSLYAGDAKTKLQSLLLEKARIDTALAQAETDWLAASEALELEMSASIMSD
jgi:ATP-binding cassette subfamily F protein 3